jgi:hypothetical protein
MVVSADQVVELAEFDLGLHPRTPLTEIPCAGIGHAIYAMDLAIWAGTAAEDSLLRIGT